MIVLSISYLDASDMMLLLQVPIFQWKVEMKTLYSWYYEKLEHEFGQFNRYHMKILVGDIDNKVMWEDIVKPASKDLEFT